MCLCLLVLPLLASAGGSRQEDRGEGPTPVGVVPFRAVALHPRHSVPAEVVSRNDARLAAQLTARIEAVTVRVGDRVEAGQVLVKLDCRAPRLALQRAQAAARLADKELKRLRALARRATASEQALNRAERSQAEAQAALGEARLQVAHCTLRAPFDGVVTAREAAVGALATPGAPLLRLLDTTAVEVRAELPPALADALRQARDLRLRTDAGEAPVTLRVLLPALDPAARTHEARLDFAGPPLPPGSAGRVRWRDPRPHVPPALVVERDGRLGVFVARDGRARFHALPGAVPGRPAPAPDLAPEAPLVRAGRFALRDGQAIRVIDHP